MKKTLGVLLISIIAIALLSACNRDVGGGGGGDVQAGSGEALEITQAMLDSAVEEPVGEANEYADRNFTIGFSQRAIAGSEWYEHLVRVAQIQADHLGVNLFVIDAAGDLAQQVSDIDTLIGMGVDAILLNPADSSGVLPAVRRIHEANIPLVVVNSALDPAGAPFSFVSTNAFDTGYKSGTELARAVIEQWGWRDQVNAAVFSANPQELESDRRRWGQISGYQDFMLQTYGRCNLVIQWFDFARWLPDVAMHLAEDMIQSNPDIDIIFSACDGTTQGIIPALQAAGKAGDVLVTSIDARSSVLRWVRDGELGVVASVSNDPRLMGKWGVLFAAAAADGKVVPASFYVPNPAITIDNVSHYYDPDSLY